MTHSKRIWAQDVRVSADMLATRLAALRAQETTGSARNDVLGAGVRELLDAARNATCRRDPLPGRISNWWRGTLVEAAYQNLHAAECLIVHLYSGVEVEAEIPEAVGRVERGLARDDPRRIAALELVEGLSTDPGRREKLAKAIEVGFGASDWEHSRLRGFRNAVVGSAAALVVMLVIFAAYVGANPDDIPFCFTPVGKPAVCPSGAASPSSHDVLAIALLGVLGGLLSAIVSIRSLHGTSLVYDVPQALAILKLPLGALSAIGGLLVIRGEFIPGFSDLDSQPQILGYAFGFGVAQQLLIGLIDKRAQNLLDSAPGKLTSATRPLRTPASMGAKPDETPVAAAPPPQSGLSRRIIDALLGPRHGTPE